MLNRRLKIVSDYIVGDALVDIGSDHAYLPIYAVNEKIIKTAICGEIARGPYDSSVKNVQQNQLSDVIKIRLGDGLSVLRSMDDADTITICGMGGPLIASIIETGMKFVRGTPRFIVQANTYPYPIRKIMAEHNYKITDELQLKDGPHFYDIIVFDYTEETVEYSEAELRFGPVNIDKREPVFIAQLEREKSHIEKILNGINDREKNIDKVVRLESNLKYVDEVLENVKDK
ncbi:tRNA (adenine(22)-N(1))-methyltransferase [Jeotgalicoccus halotolerans]|uniref:tRNA (Adenine22-N1)-methyltransferase n=1 Tax=Jeotgalicoccus halotolerans TaxID=157227 RepID=A0A3E0B189_9STAP|nr:tRNA (adenine(22)-N(1))-methyltransferase TrmK [Jeotgalicoccus halotolerans]REG25715.1 tRNA (adenine22-N1)-methyltransferase [Jeotgalicoccus halotolerans]